MTSEVWSAAVRLNLFAGLAVLAVVALRPVVVGLFGARIRYALWSVVPAAALASLWPAAVKTVMIHAPVALVAAPRAISAQAVVQAAPAATGLPWADLLALAWLVGVLAGLILVARRQRDFLRQAPRQGPAVVGLIRPRIHLPADFEGRFTPEERRLILTHERTHLARQDARVNGLMALTRCLFWFNPAVHLAVWLSRQDQEMACDEAVLARFPGARKTYAEAMLKTLVASAALPLGCYWPSRARLPLEARIKQLKTRPAGLARRTGGAFVIACLTSMAGYAAWAVQPPKIVLIAADAVPLQQAAPVALKPGHAALAIRASHKTPATPAEVLPQPATPASAADTSSEASTGPAINTTVEVNGPSSSPTVAAASDGPDVVAGLGGPPAQAGGAVQTVALTPVNLDLSPTAAPALPDPVKSRPKQIADGAMANQARHDIAQQVRGGLLMHVTIVYADGGRPF